MFRVLLFALMMLPLESVSSAEPDTIENKHIGWHSDFETKNLNDWSYLLNPQGIQVLPHPTLLNQHAAKVTIVGEQDYLWQGNVDLNRVELQHKPNQTIEGDIHKLTFSFMLPKLFTEDTHQILYWESDKTYRQSFRLQVNGNRLSLYSALLEQEVWHYIKLEPERWYKVSLLISWSTDQGTVSVDIDGVGGAYDMPTLVSEDENMFVQMGILRRQSDIEEVIWIDNVTVESSH